MARVIKDSGWARQIKELLKRKTITIGVHEADAPRPEAGPTNAQIGFWDEFGIYPNPERSFLRSTEAEKHREWIKWLKKAMQSEAHKIHALELVGQKAVADVKAKIRSNIPPELKTATKNKKGSSTALIDHAELLNSIDYEVER